MRNRQGSALTFAALIVLCLAMVTPAHAEKLVFADYFLGLHTRDVSGQAQVWRPW